jgi:collagenase-like PrtC family protease
MNRSTISLPLFTTPAPREWHGFTAMDGAEPPAPQGAYALLATADAVPAVAEGSGVGPVELLAPAGGLEAAYAALQFGADAIYLGLRQFSARAEAENFTFGELAEIVAYAHALTPRRRVFVAVNTLVRNDELPELIEALAVLAELGVDALIVQDLGVYHIARSSFPELELHASTQLAVHNRSGAQALRLLGFQRVVLARELTLDEVRDITGAAGIETEVFVHGALCYSYSGLCLFSAQTLGRSGNRGRCAYSCRDSFEVTDAPVTLRDGSAVKRDPSAGLPFSMKDLALPDRVPALRAAGVSCFKIEGRKKSALYVATATDFYRKVIDGTLDAAQQAEQASDLQAAFGRPWTRLFLDDHRDKEVAERDLIHHQGAFIGRLESIHRDRKSRRLRFRTTRAIERHDGLQIDVSAGDKPFGFGVRRMWVVKDGERREVAAAPAGALVEVALPQDHRDHPELPVGALVYCAASNAVQRRYRHDRPAPDQPPEQREQALRQATQDRTRRVTTEVCRTSPAPLPSASVASLRWSIKVDRVAFLDRFTDVDWAGIDEVVVDIARDHVTLLSERLEQLGRRLGRERIRLALPALTRQWEEHGLVHKIARFRDAGWRSWEAANLSAWTYLGLDLTGADLELDLATDWSMYALNRLAATQLLRMGVTRFALSPEDGLANLRPMLAEFGPRAVLIIYQDTPMFQAESCAYANLIGGCPGKANCRFESMDMVSSHGERVTAIDYHCRTIVLNQGPFCLAPRLGELAAAGAVSVRADFVYRAYTPEIVVERWRAVRGGQPVPGGHAANFDRGVL